MNKGNAKDFLPLVQALADGKTIQYKNHLGEWSDVPDVVFTAAISRYRIKPEPIERWGVANENGRFVTTYDDESQAKHRVAGLARWRYFLMREVV